MIKFIRKIKKSINVLNNIEELERKTKDIQRKLAQTAEENSKHFEEKIKQMSFDYTKNLDDTKSDYLKIYLETRINCLQQSIYAIPKQIEGMQERLNKTQENLEKTQNDIIKIESFIGEEVKD